MLNSISRCAVRTFSALAVAVAACVACATSAQAASSYIFSGKTLPISHVQSYGGKTAIAVDDPGLRALLSDVGAALTWNRGDRYVLFTTAEPRIISFAVGDTRYDVGPVTAQAAFAPYEYGNTVYVPFDELLRALYLAPKPDGRDIVIQPQLAAIDVQAAEGSVRIVGRAGIALHPKITNESADRLVYSFDGVGTTLQSSRSVNAPGLHAIDVAQTGSVREPVTQVTLVLTPGATHGAPSSDDGRDFIVSVAGSGVKAPPIAAAAPVEQPAPEASSLPTPAAASADAEVTAVDERVEGGDFTVAISVTGDATYAWHRLAAPNGLFWVDVKNAHLAMSPRDDPGNAFASGVRIRQMDASTVRVALTLQGFKNLDVAPTANGLEVVVHSTLAPASVARSGTGATGAAAVAAASAATAEPAEATPTPGPWKFAQRPTTGGTYVAANPRLIVIDPGHGGSDPGAVHGGQEEKNLTLDMAKRLRDVLTARGWQVIMTRDTDVDVYKPFDSAHVELQARDDVANKPGARLLVSIHVNSYVNSGPRGTTTYYSKPEDVPLAQDVQHELAASLGTVDDGIVKSQLYVTLHAKMPAILVETAFLTNPSDFAKLTSPAWRQKVAEAIAQGIGDYAGAPPAPPSSDQ